MDISALLVPELVWLRPISLALVALGWVLGGGAVGAAKDEHAAVLKGVVRAGQSGEVAGLDPLMSVHDGDAAASVLRLVGDDDVSQDVKTRLAGIVSQWPGGGGGVEFLAEQARGQRRAKEDVLRFYAMAAREEFKPIFLALVEPLAAKPEVRVTEPGRLAIAVMALGKFPTHKDATVAYISGLLPGKHPHVLRDAAAEALGGIRHAGGLAGLAAVVDDPAIGSTVRRSLYRLTGQDFGTDRGKWTEWLGRQGGPPELKMLDLAAWESHLKVAAAEGDLQVAGGGFYGLPFTGRNVLFVLDCSGSMSAQMANNTRIGVLKEQMSGLLAELAAKPESLRFGILTFESRLGFCFPGTGLKDNTAASRKRAGRFVSGMQASGGTSMVAAMRHVVTKVLPDGDVDTIYLLSDGQPTDGNPLDVLNLVDQASYGHRVRIHTIEITGGGVRAAPAGKAKGTLLEQIAARTGGTYVTK